MAQGSPPLSTLLLDDVEIDGRGGMSVRVAGGVVSAVGPSEEVRDRTPPAHIVVAGDGNALLPGLHDHHVHLFALARRPTSVWCGPPEVTGPDELRDRLRAAAAEVAGDGWLRAIGWDDSAAGWPDRTFLDAAVPGRPVRLQHRSGALWVLNTEAVDALGLDPGVALPAGVETSRDGTPTGRFFGLDGWLRARIGGTFPSLAEVGAALATYGITGVTDATAGNGVPELGGLAAAAQRGELPQRVVAMTGHVDTQAPEGVARGCVKVVLAHASLPALDDLAAHVAAVHAVGRRVAVHAVDRASLVLAVAALTEAGSLEGDRVEHASVTPDEMLDPLARLGVTVVTQHNFLREHGDRYLATVDAADLPFLYRGRAFLDAAIPLAGSSDAPFGSPDPWAAMAAAVARRSASGHLIGDGEGLAPAEALRLYTGQPDAPARCRTVRAGIPADLCLLDRTRQRAYANLAEVGVRATVIGGRLVHTANEGASGHG